MIACSGACFEFQPFTNNYKWTKNNWSRFCIFQNSTQHICDIVQPVHAHVFLTFLCSFTSTSWGSECKTRLHAVFRRLFLPILSTSSMFSFINISAVHFTGVWWKHGQRHRAVPLLELAFHSSLHQVSSLWLAEAHQHACWSYWMPLHW
jgi:hypothetical protein